MKQTAVEWLHQKLATSSQEEVAGKINIWFMEAKAMEKEQIVDAFDNGAEEWTPIEYSDGQHYYNHNFES
jgi:hypothetical protein